MPVLHAAILALATTVSAVVGEFDLLVNVVTAVSPFLLSNNAAIELTYRTSTPVPPGTWIGLWRCCEGDSANLTAAELVNASLPLRIVEIASTRGKATLILTNYRGPLTTMILIGGLDAPTIVWAPATSAMRQLDFADRNEALRRRRRGPPKMPASLLRSTEQERMATLIA